MPESVPQPAGDTDVSRLGVSPALCCSCNYHHQDLFRAQQALNLRLSIKAHVPRASLTLREKSLSLSMFFLSEFRTPLKSTPFIKNIARAMRGQELVLYHAKTAWMPPPCHQIANDCAIDQPLLPAAPSKNSDWGPDRKTSQSNVLKKTPLRMKI